MLEELENIKQEKLASMKPLKFVVNEICDCLASKQEVAAFTLTNYLFEASLKLMMIYWEARGKLIENLEDFQNLYRKGTKKYLGKDMYKVINIASGSKLITESEKEELLFFLNNYRDPFSHATNNSVINRTKLMAFDESMSFQKISVNGNPALYFDHQERYMRSMASQYFTRLYSYIQKWDKFICELRHPADNN